MNKALVVDGNVLKNSSRKRERRKIADGKMKRVNRRYYW